MKQYDIERSLDTCLLTDEEMRQDWDDFVDPIPPFTVAS
ncbi:Aldo/keto reductase [Bacillus sp. IT-79MI2]|nr:hypothetical protein BTH41_01146 [Bacillus mycoides]